MDNIKVLFRHIGANIGVNIGVIYIGVRLRALHGA